MRNGILVSGALHVGVIGAALIAWPQAFDLSAEPPPMLTVELVTVTDETNIRPAARPEPAPLEPDEPLPVAPEILIQTQLSLAELEPEPEPAPVELVEEEPPPSPRPRPEPQPPPQFDVNAVLALLDRRSLDTADTDDTAMRGIGAQNAVTMDIRDALLVQMRQCWTVPMGAPNPEELIVHVRVFLTPGGGLARPPQLMPESRAAAASSAYVRTAAESALRAINVCEPYRNLPVENYDAWREIVMTFDPSRMAGR